SVLFLIFLGCLVFLSIRTAAAEKTRLLPLAWGVIAMAFIMLMAARIQVPVSNQASARYVYFVVTLLSLIYGLALEKVLAMRQHYVEYIALLPGCFMVVLSLSFI